MGILSHFSSISLPLLFQFSPSFLNHTLPQSSTTHVCYDRYSFPSILPHFPPFSSIFPFSLFFGLQNPSLVISVAVSADVCVNVILHSKVKQPL